MWIGLGKVKLLCSPWELPHIVGVGLPPDTKNWSVLQMWFNCSGPATEKCSISNRIWQIFEFVFTTVNWQLPVPSYCMKWKFWKYDQLEEWSLLLFESTYLIGVIWINEVSTILTHNFATRSHNYSKVLLSFMKCDGDYIIHHLKYIQTQQIP